MTASGETGDTQPAEHRQSRGIKVVGGDLRLSDLTISIGEDGEPVAAPPRVELRTDMWPFWLEEAIEAAAIASDVGRRIPALVEQLEEALELDDKARAGAVEDALTAILSCELRASMRAMTSCAFAIDAFYAMVKARSPDIHSRWSGLRTGPLAKHKSVRHSDTNSGSAMRSREIASEPV
jgi:hypothetical protein